MLRTPSPEPCTIGNAALQQYALFSANNRSIFPVSDRSSGTYGDKIMNFMTELKKHREYVRTMREIQELPLKTALDLGIYPGDAKDIARRAVYGK